MGTGLSPTPCHIDELSREANLTAQATAGALTLLELKGLVRQAAPMQYVLR
ncbi:hypothetical protein [Candidatus Chloroploca sp. Khr17]|uniref:DprA-like winged helix domain-containing protein n=1 Tax=Candidatus Chloroploca sp. Khr17 TaxID=2496869 RepID=UPI0013E9F0EE|nr:hypothetical protein [Candidatus Chloroploca sp. Khr17]